MASEGLVGEAESFVQPASARTEVVAIASKSLVIIFSFIVRGKALYAAGH